MVEKIININLDDNRAGKIAEALSNKTCKKILGLLAEKDMNASEIAGEIGAPLNTVEYNLDKLIEAGMIEKLEKPFWSIKGKKIDRYRIANKKIVISPRTMFKGVIPAVLISGIAAAAIKVFYGTRADKITASREVEQEVFDKAMAAGKDAGMDLIEEESYAVASSSIPGAEKAGEMVESVSGISNIMQGSDVWLWFLFGALFALLIVLVWNWKRF